MEQEDRPFQQLILKTKSGKIYTFMGPPQIGETELKDDPVTGIHVSAPTTVAEQKAHKSGPEDEVIA